MSEMGCCWFHRRFCTDETVRGESYSRRHSQACLQNTSDEACDVRVIDFRCDAFSSGLAAGAEAGLVPVRRCLGEGGSAHVEAAVYVQDVSRDV